MRNSFLLRTLAALALPAIGLSACSENDEPGNNGQTTATSDGKFVIAATVTLGIRRQASIRSPLGQDGRIA